MNDSYHRVNLKKDASVSDQFREACLKCEGAPFHEVLSSISRKTDTSNGEHYDEYYEKYEIIKCLACNSISFKQYSSDAEIEGVDVDGKVLYYGWEETLYPERKKIKPISGSYLLPVGLQAIYTEIIDAVNLNLQILSSTGFRIIIETICNDMDVKGKLSQKIDCLVEKKIITTRNADLLHKFRKCGNDAAHEAKCTIIDFELALDIINHLLSEVYLTPLKAQDF